MKVSPAHVPTPRNETGHVFAVATVWNADALSELEFFEGVLEGEKGQV